LHHNSDREHKSIQSSFPSGSLVGIINKSSNDDSLATPIDILSIDRYSRLTLTKKVKKILGLNPEDKIIVYQEKHNKIEDVILKVQHKDKDGIAEVDRWILKRCKPSSFNDNDDDDANTDFKHDTSIDVKGIEQNEKVKEEEKHHHNENSSVYQIPILLVDDEPDLLLTFEYILKNEGYKNIKTFSDSKSLLKHLLDVNDSTNYKLVITDIRMPQINGVQLYQVLKIINPSIKIMFMTALDVVNELSSICPDIKSEDILKKPIESSFFIKKINDKVSNL